jgi:hypothetical protein
VGELMSAGLRLLRWNLTPSTRATNRSAIIQAKEGDVIPPARPSRRNHSLVTRSTYDRSCRRSLCHTLARLFQRSSRLRL